MIAFIFILVMLTAVLLSNLINRFIPALSAPLVQMALGMLLISLLPFNEFGLEFELDPNLFFVLFISPLIFRAGYTFDKRTLWEMKGPIIGSAVFLVFLTVISMGVFFNLVVPVIPLAASFALIGALGPTDDVAVTAVSKRVAVPEKIMGILGGESIVNDASGIVCFQFAIAAMLTGSFSPAEAIIQFVLVGLGGILIGITVTLVKYIVVKWLHSLGIGNITLHVLIDVLTPFIIYIIAELCSVSGILGVFSAGITHSFMREKFNPEKIKLNISMDSVWDFVVFSLEGIVFVMLGAQLPVILRTIDSGVFSINTLEIFICILLIMFLFLVLRFFWWIITVPHMQYQEKGKAVINRYRAGFIFSLAGVRGAVTLACVMSIPFSLDDGTAFPERDLIILMASGVIVLSMLISNFIMPLIVGKKSVETQDNDEKEAALEIIREVISQLKKEITEENRIATDIVVQSYSKRSLALQNKKTSGEHKRIEKEIRKQIYIWEEESTRALLEKGEVSEAAAEQFLYILKKRVKGNARATILHRLVFYIKYVKRFRLKTSGLKPRRGEIAQLLTANSRYIRKKLDKLQNKENAIIVEMLAAEFRVMSAASGFRARRTQFGVFGENYNTSVYNVAVRGFYIERKLIHEMFEANRISRETVADMRATIAAMETQLSE
ncbi:MAG: sodium:proton antiporter [Oscillospiraceae bacterium]|nr:sodium:proton antiporter [Oscillospiraceae bacterium]